MIKSIILVKISILVLLSFSMVLSANATSSNSGNETIQHSSQLNIQKIASVSTTDSQTPTLVSSNPSSSWQELGPLPLTNPNNIITWGSAPYSGRVTAIAINSSNTQEIYIGTAQGGVWKTLNGGSTWKPLMDNLNTLAVGSIAISPDQKTLYVGTGEGNHGGDNYVGIGLLKSTDEGKTWTLLGANYFNDSSISSIAIRTNNPYDILVATTWGMYAKGLASSSNVNGLGVYLSTDGGVTWTRTLSQLSTATNGVAELLVNVSNDNIIYASDYGGYVWQSTDGGVTWAQYIYESSTANQGRVSIAMTPANSSYLYAAFVNSTGDIVDMTAYDGSTFYNFNSLPAPSSNQYGPCTGQCWYDLLIKVDPTNVNTIYVGTNNLYKSTDGGTTWTFLGGAEHQGYLHPDMHAFAFEPGNPSVIYSGNDGGIYKSSNGGSTWTSLNTNLGTLQFDSIAASPTNDAHLLGGVQDNACDIYTNSTSWTIAAGGDGAASMFFADTEMACNYVNLGPRFSVDNGKTFTTVASGINTNDPTLFYAPMVQDPSNIYTVYLGSNRIYKLNSATSTSWTAISGQISAGTISSIAVAKTNGQVLVEGDTKGVVELSTNGGTGWSQIFSTSSFYSKNVPISSVAIDPFNASIIYVALANNTNPRLLFTPDQGSTWYYYYLTGVPDVAINVIKINPITDVPFIGTDRGLYYLNETGSWNTLGSGLPNAAIYDLTFTASNYLVVGTHGRGVWLNYMTPFVTIDLKNDTSYQTGKQVSVSITDANGFTNASYTWDTGMNLTATGNFITDIPASEGQHVLTVYAKDPAGNWVTKIYIFRTDNTPPSIILSGLTNNTEINTGSTINLLISDSSPIQSIFYSWNGNSNTNLVVINGKASITAPTNVGKSVLTISATDSATNTISKTFIFTIITQSTSQSSTSTTNTTGNKNSPGFELVTLISIMMLLAITKKKHMKK